MRRARIPFLDLLNSIHIYIPVSVPPAEYMKTPYFLSL